MAEFKISRIRYTWKGIWTTATSYQKDDVVQYAGSAWVCKRLHTSTGFNADYTFVPPGETLAQPAWLMMAKGIAFRGSWQPSTLYFPGEVVQQGGYLWINIQAHTSTTFFDTEIANWAEYAVTVDWNSNWQFNTRYGVGDLVRYNGIVYKCIVGHTSAATADLGLEADQSKWSVYFSGLQYVGEFTDDVKLKVNDLVKYGGSLLRVVNGHISGLYLDPDHFVTEIPGSKIQGIWSAVTYYAVGDVVQHGGYVYRSISNNQNKIPGDSIYQPDAVNWQLIEKGVNLRGAWQTGASYKTGDVVLRGGNLYVALLDTTDDDSSLDYLDAGNWQLINPGQAWRESWTIAHTYAVGDVVKYKGSAFVANVEHTSDEQNFPGDNGEGFEYWDLIVEGSTRAGLLNEGDLLTYGLSRSAVGDGSTLGETNIPLGEEGNVLAVGNDDTPEYIRFGLSSRHFYVNAYIGVDSDDPTAGLDPFRPYKSIRFAAERADDGFAGHSTLEVATGEYVEVLPIIVPKRTVVLGDELRSVRVKANPAIAAYQTDTSYRLLTLNRLKTLCRSIILNQPITKTPGNTQNQVFVVDQVSAGISPVTGEELFSESSVFGNAETADAVDGLIDDMIQYINFNVIGTGLDVDLTGSNTITSDIDDIKGARALLANAEFLAAESAAYLTAFYPLYEYLPEIYTVDIKRYIKAFSKDLNYPGNYKSVLEARYYANSINGSQFEDMYYLRDASGLRNHTVFGLSGTLNPPNVFQQYQRPTGGAYASLDPGWGPAHEECWIMTRSPYIQNLTTFGENCIGQKIDGALHNGGNKSIVSNDFTQVISDGIGAWVLNNGRAELVSVFTYYAQVSYLAENGGVIRGTNGNSSYGFIGALADGNDSSETPINATVNTRTEQAVVASAFAGEVNDEILTLEFSSCGQNYTTASYTFVGSGTNAAVLQEEFRDDALTKARIVTGESSSAAGGGGYTLIGNNAQSGNTTGIVIASNDENDPANLIGLRIIIVSGEGTGQYGYVQNYVKVTKQVTVYRESDNQPGWDHVTPGYPIAAILTTGTRYRFEPRIQFSAPAFSAADISLDAGTVWSDITYGETSFSQSGVAGDPGTGSVIDVLPSTATFDVVKIGKDYTVTIRNSGAGYAVGDTIVIEGTQLVANSPDNDITITVTDVSDDSTNSILSFTYSGTASSGSFVAVAGTGTTTNYSTDGTNWSTGNMPSSGNWISIAAGDNRFVAVKTDSANSAYSLNGITWIQRNLPTSSTWESVAYGGGVFVAVSSTGNDAAFSNNGGVSWTAADLPAFDSTNNEWCDITYGKGKFVAISRSNNLAAVGTYNGSTIVWQTYIMDVIADSSQKDWKSVAYGNNRFVAMSSQGDIGYSFDGETWLPAATPLIDGSTILSWNDMKFGGGVFVAVLDTGAAPIFGDATLGPVDYIYQSYDGIVWEQKNITNNGNWNRITFGNPDITLGDGGDNRKGMWIILNRDITISHKRIYTGARALGRCMVVSGRIREVRLWEPGSGYSSTPTYTITDPNNTADIELDLSLLADRVLAQPSWINRGTRYKTSTTTVRVLGDGFSDNYPTGKFIIISGISVLIGPGTQLRITGNPKLYTVVAIETESQAADNTYTLRLRVSPDINLEEEVLHGTTCELRTRYSQVRISGHDFLDVGTGNFLETNYPELYSGSYISYPENEVQEENGGRVFYTSTDQSGNFRCGELFAVEQATGIVTISADFFDLGGLTELALGGIRVGGTGTVIREFSTDPLFTADSNNIVPTQRAIKAYLSNRLNVGGADLLTASFIAGTVKVGPGEIRNTAGLTINIPVLANFSGPKAGLRGSILAQTMFYRSFKDRI
jgi:hypothetical protein